MNRNKKFFTFQIHSCIIPSEVMNMATDKHRYTVSLDEETFQRLEDFRFSHRYQSRAEATAKLILLGLEAAEKQQEQTEKNV